MASNITHTSQDELSLAEARCNTNKSKLVHLDALFKKLAAEENPDFLTVMTAISEMVAFVTNSDSNTNSLEDLPEFKSQNRCRFCP